MRAYRLPPPPEAKFTVTQNQLGIAEMCARIGDSYAEDTQKLMEHIAQRDGVGSAEYGCARAARNAYLKYAMEIRRMARMG